MGRQKSTPISAKIEWSKKAQKKPNTTSPRSTDSLQFTSQGCGDGFPPLGWGKQSVWLAASGAKRIFCGQKPAPTSRPVDRMSEGKRPAATSNILPSAQDDAVPIPRRFGENRWPPNCPRWKCSGFTAGLFSPGVRLSLDHRLYHATQRQEK